MRPLRPPRDPPINTTIRAAGRHRHAWADGRAGSNSPSAVGFTKRAAVAWSTARRRYGWLDHLVRAGVRYDEADGGRLAAAVTYYAFFATFALALLGFSIFGFVLDDPAVERSVQRYLAQNLPRLDVQALRNARGTAGVIAFIGLPVTGWFWVDALRSTIRKVWRLPEYPGNFFVRLLIDLLVLVGLGVLLAVSLAVAFATTALAGRLVNAAGTGATPARWLLAAVGFVLGVGVNTLLSIAVLTGLPRLRMPLRRVLGPALLVAAGLELLKTVGQLYVHRIEANPTYQVVAGAVGLLVFLNVVNHLILFAAALTATGTAGQVTDLAVRPTRDRRPP
jgi:membrane protein